MKFRTGYDALFVNTTDKESKQMENPLKRLPETENGIL